jgi:hypothetical protein
MCPSSLWLGIAAALSFAVYLTGYYWSELSRSAWEALKVYLKSTVPGQDAVPGAVIAIQTFGDFLGFNPHCHILSTDGCFLGTTEVLSHHDPG